MDVGWVTAAITCVLYHKEPTTTITSCRSLVQKRKKATMSKHSTKCLFFQLKNMINFKYKVCV